MRRYISWLAVAVSTITLALVGSVSRGGRALGPGDREPGRHDRAVEPGASVEQGRRRREVRGRGLDGRGLLRERSSSARRPPTPTRRRSRTCRSGRSTGGCGPWTSPGSPAPTTPPRFTRALDSSPVLDLPHRRHDARLPQRGAVVPVGALRRRKDLRAAGRRRLGVHRRAAPIVTPNTSYSPLDSPAFDTPVYWRVRAKSANNVYSQWSDAVHVHGHAGTPRPR